MKDEKDWKTFVFMLTRDTTPQGMSPKARENRHKPTGRAKLNQAVAAQHAQGCRHAGCEAEPTAFVPVLVWGRRAWRGFCAEHVGLYTDELQA